MELIVLVFNTIFFGPIVNTLIFLYKTLTLIHFPGALGFAIIILTVLIRFLVWPFTAQQVKSAQKMASLKPLLDELKGKHKDDKQAFASAQMALYKEHGVNPAGGCLPALIQIPVFIALYQSILNVVPTMQDGSSGLSYINSVLYSSWLHLEKLPDTSFFGINLASRPSDFTHGGIWLLSIPIITAALTFIQSKMMAPVKPLSHHRDEKPKEIKEKEGMEEAMASMQGQMTYLLPVMIGYFAFQFPVGLAFYWNTFTIMGIIQQYKIAGWGGLSDLIKIIWKKT
ncbi:MAG: Uncharacterized protein G01um101493_167 [Microgenomates group bacterium Gr01-1014_93]|nr:MAG: Uncharacterized protein G01um101493_167 [Microgenomates group bacterium Gr01-1014_93]